MNDITIENLNKILEDITNQGWILNKRVNNQGAVGNTLEDLLSVQENNYPLPDFHNWELKAQEKGQNTLVTLFHSEPEPRSMKFVPQILLPNFGWPHTDAGIKYPKTERRISLTINNSFSPKGRGFKIAADYEQKRIYVDFDADKISESFKEWIPDRMTVQNSFQAPYWTFSTIENKLHSKLNNTIYIQADKKKEGRDTYFKYEHFLLLMNPSLDLFLNQLNQGAVYADFDARTGHNHGSKMRIMRNNLPNLFKTQIKI